MEGIRVQRASVKLREDVVVEPDFVNVVLEVSDRVGVQRLELAFEEKLVGSRATGEQIDAFEPMNLVGPTEPGQDVHAGRAEECIVAVCRQADELTADFAAAE